MRKISTILICAMLIASSFIIMIGNDVQGKDDGNEGRALYQIFTLADLQDINGHRDQDHILMNDIDASETVNWNGGQGFDTIGGFAGTFNGQNYTISGLYMNRPTENFVGLISIMTTGSLVWNLNLVDVDITGDDWVGGLVGIKNDGAIDNCMVSGEVFGAQSVGGLVGQSSAGPITSSSSSGNVVGTDGYVGGLVGNNHNQIFDSYSQADVIGSSQANGGLVGFNQVTGEIRRCYATGSVYSSSSYVGGFAGSNFGDIYDSYALGDAEAVFDFVGGFVGSMQETGSTTIENCYSTGSATGGTSGGFIGNLPSGTVTNCYWDLDTSGLGTSAGPETGLTTAQAMTQASYGGWDFGTIWWMVDGYTRPFLRMEWDTEIRNTHQLQMMKMNAASLAADYTLMNDIVMDDLVDPASMWGTSPASVGGFDRIGINTAKFEGTFDGQGFTITNLYINRPSDNYNSLFGFTDSTFDVQSLGLVNVNITGGGWIAGIAGASEGMFMDCYVTGTLRGEQYVGGITGWTMAAVYDCYANCEIIGTGSAGGDFIGGLVGSSLDGNIGACYSTGSVTGDEYVGGLIGSNTGAVINVINCYSTGQITATSTPVGGLVADDNNNGANIINCFWDTDTSGQAASDGGTGITTAQALTEATYTGAGWDFTNDWIMWENDTRPFLRWEYDTKITNSHELQLMQMDLAADYEVVSDIDVSDTSEATQMWGTNASNGGKGFMPVGNNTIPFSGSLDGGGYNINYIFIDRQNEFFNGLFGIIWGAYVGDLNLMGANISGYQSVGIVAGQCVSNSVIDNCHSNGSVTSSSLWGGGIVGLISSGGVKNCTANVNVTDTDWGSVGGIAGDNRGGGIIENCVSYGKITGYGSMNGGIVGELGHGTINNCISYGNVSSNNTGWIGGIVGITTEADSIIMNSVSYGDVYSPLYLVGGIVGFAVNGEVENCSSYGNVTGWGSVGGIVGRMDEGNVTDCTNFGIISGSDNNVAGVVGELSIGHVSWSNNSGDIHSSSDVCGGIVGVSTSASISNCHNTGDVTGRDNTGGVVGRMMSSGTVANCTTTGDIALSLGGSLSGGFAGLLQNNCIIRDSWASGIVDGGTRPGMAGFIAENSGTIINCSASGDVTGGNENGGFVCMNYGTGQIIDCQAFGNTTGTGWIGGFSSRNYGFIYDSQSFGTVSGSSNYIGGFSGYNDGNITLVENHGNVTCTLGGTMGIGGIVGDNYGIVADSINYGPVQGDNSAGGIVGQSYGSVHDSINYGVVSSTDVCVGGIVGYNDGSSGYGYVNGSTSYADVTGIDYVGGIVGYDSSGSINNCTSFKNVSGSGTTDVGGLIGTLDGGTVNACFSYANATGVGNTGGLVGYSQGTVIGSESHGLVNGTGDNVGGLIGWLVAGSVESSEFNGAVIGYKNNTGGLIGLCDAPVTNSTSYGDVYNMAGTSENYFNTGGLIGLLSSSTVSFCESYGNVSGGKFNVGGLIAYINPGAMVTNSSAYGTVIGAGNYIGGLVGRNEGTIVWCSAYGDTGVTDLHSWVGGLAGENLGLGVIQNSSAHGDVIGSGTLGGFVGRNTGLIERSYSDGTVTASGYNVGGFVGHNGHMAADGDIIDSYSHSDVTGNYRVGGFVGNHTGASTLTNAYSTGLVTGNTETGGFAGVNWASTITDCHWDTETSGWATSAGGIDQTTSEMMLQPTFTNWDFTTIWGIYETNTYPFLQAVGPTPATPSADLNLTVELASSFVNVGDPVTYYANITNDGPNNAANINVTLMGSGNDVIYLGNNQTSDTILWQGGLSWAIVSLINGETASLQINLTANESGTFDLAGTSVSTTTDPDMTNNDVTSIVTINAPPIAANDTYMTTEDSGVNTIDVLANDTDADGDDLTIISVTQGVNGAVVIIDAGKNVTYEPDANWFGADFFNYTISDGNGRTDTATVNITVISVNDMPIAVDDAYTIDEDTVLVAGGSGVLANDNDPDTSDIYQVVGNDPVTANGINMVVNPDGIFTYLTNDNATYQGLGVGESMIDTFTYMIHDGNGGFDNATVTITITGVNDLPVMTNGFSESTFNTGSNFSMNFTATDADTNDTLTWTLTSGSSWMYIDPVTGEFTGNPGETDAGYYNVSVSVSDGNGGIAYNNATLLFLLDTDGDGDHDGIDGDDDGDGVVDSEDDFPTDPTEDTDTDDDGIGDNADTDDDADGVPDVDDAFPTDPDETVDTDGDGIGNNEDPDDDGDGVLDVDDLDPLDDTVGAEVVPTDTDDDGVPDADDAFPTDANETADTDGDGVGDNADAFPSDSTEDTDTDGDGTGDNGDAFPTDPAASVDADNDGAPDEWNDGYTADDSTTDLILDDIVEDVDDDPDDDADDEDDPANNWLYIILILVVVGVIALLLIMKGKGKKDEPVAEGTTEEPMEEPMEEPVEEPEAEEPAPAESMDSEPEQTGLEDEVE